MDERHVDKKLLVFASVGRLCCTIARGLLDCWEQKLQVPLDLLMKEHFDKNGFSVMADLDVPTSDDRVVQGKLETATSGSYSHHGIAWESLSVVLNLFSSITRLVVEFGVLAKVVGSQQDGIPFAIAHLGQELSRFFLAPEWTFARTAS